MTLAHKYSLVAGASYLALGVVGPFRTGLSGGTDMMNDMLFGAAAVKLLRRIHNKMCGSRHGDISGVKRGCPSPICLHDGR